MKLLVGLGNPGNKFKNNRHNIGHMFVDYLASQELLLQARKTNVFMNESGIFVKKHLTNLADLANLYIAHDDLDIPLGKYKIQFGVGPKVHNGITSIEQQIGTSEFWRIRIGVDNRDKLIRTPGDQYVLQDFTKEELEILKGVFLGITQELKRLIS